MATDVQDMTLTLPVSRLPICRQTHPVALAVRQRLDASTYGELRTVECLLHEGHLTLSGVVSTFYLKQLATSLAGGVEGVEQIDNRLDVIDFRTPMRPLPA